MIHPLYFWVFMAYHECVFTTVVIFVSLPVMREHFTTKNSRQLGLGGVLSIPNFAENGPVSAVFLTKIIFPLHVTHWVNKGELSFLQIYHNKSPMVSS